MWRAITAVALVIAVLAGSGVYLGYTLGPDQPPPLAPGPLVTRPPVPQTKPSQPPLPEGTQVPTPMDLGRLVPTVSTPPVGVSCPPRWLFFDNPALHYSICYPPGWGVTDFSTSGPLTAIPTRQLGSVYIVSPEAFPNPVGIPYMELPAGVQAWLEQAVTVTIEPFAPGEAREGCYPSTPISISGVQATWCEDVYDILPGPEARFSSEGSRHTLVVFLPLARPPDLHADAPPELREGQPRSGWQLNILVTSQAASYPKGKDLQWQIVGTVRVY